MMHTGLDGVLTSILKDASLSSMAMVTTARGLRAADASTPGVVVALDFFA
jgi:hypothetical protein